MKKKRKKKLPMWKLLGLPTPLKPWVNGKQTCPYRIYRVWRCVKTRSNPPRSFRRSSNYKYYAHVTLCAAWRKFPPFYFWAMSHGYRDDRTIDRKDWRKGYCPKNCRWATYSQQASNCHRDTPEYRAAMRRNALKSVAARKAKRGS